MDVARPARRDVVAVLDDECVGVVVAGAAAQGPRPALELRALTLNQNYSFAIEAFNESGVSKLGPITHIP